MSGRDRPSASRRLTWRREHSVHNKNGWQDTGFAADHARPDTGDRLPPAAAFAVLDSSV